MEIVKLRKVLKTLGKKGHFAQVARYQYTLCPAIDTGQNRLKGLRIAQSTKTAFLLDYGKQPLQSGLLCSTRSGACNPAGIVARFPAQFSMECILQDANINQLNFTGAEIPLSGLFCALWKVSIVAYIIACNLTGAETLPPGRLCQIVPDRKLSTGNPHIHSPLHYGKLGVLVDYNTQSDIMPKMIMSNDDADSQNAPEEAPSIV